jgi:hypothetical protein
VKRLDLERHLRKHGCAFLREESLDLVEPDQSKDNQLAAPS